MQGERRSRWTRSGLLLGAVLISGSSLVAVPAGTSAAATRLIVVQQGAGAQLGPSLGSTNPKTGIAVDLVLASDGHSGVSSAARHAFEARLAGEARPVEAWLRAKHIGFARIGAALHISSTTGTVASLLHTSFSNYRYDSKVVYASGAAKLPASISARITAVIGLDDIPLQAPNSAVRLGAPPKKWTPGPGQQADATTLTPSACSAASTYASDYGFHTMIQSGAHYGGSALFANGNLGDGVTIAAVEFAPSTPSDISAYDSCFGINYSNYSVQAEDGGGSSSDSFESNLDIEELQTQAPGAKVISYEAPDTGAGWYDALNPIVNNSSVKVVSISWGMCEALTSQSQVNAIDALLSQAASQGQTVAASSGDQGAEGCYNKSTGTNPSVISVNFPASDPNVTAVGGSVIGTPDTVWNDAYGASGGGVSTDFAEPSWQTAAAGSLSGRALPDISADAYGIVLYDAGAWSAGAGTSFAAPMLAGMIADVVPSCSSAIGNFAPRLYAWYAKTGYGTALTDVVSGNNDFNGDNNGNYKAGGGYDLASGLGTPIVSGMLCPEGISLSSSSGAAGTPLTITGQNLADASVTFGGATAAITNQSATSLTVTVPTGTGSVPVVVSNPTGSAAAQTFSYAAPTFTSASSATAEVGTSFSFSVTTSATGTPTITSAGTLPSGITFKDNGDGTATYSGTAVAGSGGTYHLTLSATNTAGSAVQNFTLTVDQAPSFSGPASFDFSTSGSSSFTPSVAGFPTPAVSESGTLPSGVSWSGTTFSGMPAVGSSPSYTVTLTASNGVAPDATESVTIDVSSGPAFDSSDAASLTVDAGSSGQTSLAASSSPAPTYALVGSAPPWVSIDSSTGMLSASPPAGAGGSYPVTVEASNAQGSVQTQVSVVVDEAPALTGAVIAFGVGKPGGYQVTQNGNPVPSYTETGTLPGGISFDAATGTFAGTALSGSVGTYSATVNATNSVGSSSATYTIDIAQPPSFTGGTSTTGTVDQALSFTITASGTNPMTFSSSNLPSWLNLSSGGVLTGTPSAGGTDTFSVTAANAAGSLTEQISIIVSTGVTGGTSPGGPSGAPPAGGGPTGSPGSTGTAGSTGGTAPSPGPSPAPPTALPAQPVTGPTGGTGSSSPSTGGTGSTGATSRAPSTGATVHRADPVLSVSAAKAVSGSGSRAVLVLTVTGPAHTKATVELTVGKHLLAVDHVSIANPKGTPTELALNPALKTLLDQAKGHEITAVETTTAARATPLITDLAFREVKGGAIEVRVFVPALSAVPANAVTSLKGAPSLEVQLTGPARTTGKVTLSTGKRVLAAERFGIRNPNGTSEVLHLNNVVIALLAHAKGHQLGALERTVDGGKVVVSHLLLREVKGGAIDVSVVPVKSVTKRPTPGRHPRRRQRPRAPR